MREGWVNFQRHKTIEGFIDIWMGDSADDPNKPNKSHSLLNSSAYYYRLNGKGLWYNRRDFINNIHQLIYQLKDEYSADDIWLVAQLNITEE